VGQVANLRADWQSAQFGRVDNPPQDDILPHNFVYSGSGRVYKMEKLACTECHYC
jgi:hypothetical protein